MFNKLEYLLMYQNFDMRLIDTCSYCIVVNILFATKNAHFVIQFLYLKNVLLANCFKFLPNSQNLIIYHVLPWF